jgi:hypothetical protein
VAKGVYGIDVFETLFGKCLFKIFSADSVDTVACQCFPALADEEIVSVRGPWSDTIFFDIELEKLNGFELKPDDTVAIPLSTNGKGFFLSVEVVKLQHGDLAGPGARVIKEVQEGIIPKAVLSFEIHRLEDLEDFFLIKETDQGLLGAFLRDIEDPVGQFPLFRVHKTDHPGKGFDGRKPVIAGFGNVFAVPLQIIEEGQNQLDGKVIKCERGDFDAMVFCGEREEKLKGIPIAFDGMRTGSLNVREVSVKKLVEQGSQFHS